MAALVRGNPDLERLAFYPLLAPGQKAAALDAVLAAARGQRHRAQVLPAWWPRPRA